MLGVGLMAKHEGVTPRHSSDAPEPAPPSEDEDLALELLTTLLTPQREKVKGVAYSRTSEHKRAFLKLQLKRRKALVRLLRGSAPIRREIRNLLADYFTPTRQPDHQRKTKILQHVWSLIKDGKTKDAAYQSAADKFGGPMISKDAVRKLWERFDKSRKDAGVPDWHNDL